MQFVLLLLTFCRGPLAFFFLSPSPQLRILAISLAMFTDCIDGWLARRFRSTSKFGAILDPIMDKFFVYFVLVVLTTEMQISISSAVAMVSRDIALFIFALYLLFTGQFKISQLRSIILGKISTALQFAFIIAICFGAHPSEIFYLSFVILALFALVELFWPQLKKLKQSKEIK